MPQPGPDPFWQLPESIRGRPATRKTVVSGYLQSNRYWQRRVSLYRYPPGTPVPSAPRLFPGLPAKRRSCSSSVTSGKNGFLLFVSRLIDQISCPHQRIEGACICPPSIQVAERHCPFLDIGVVDVGDFQFSAFRRLQAARFLEYAFVIHVDTRDGVIRFGLLGFLFNAYNPVALNFGHPKALGIRNFLQQDLRALLLRGELAYRLGNRSFYDVVAENDADSFAFGEVFGQCQGFGDAAFTFLVRVVNVFQAEFFAVR